MVSLASGVFDPADSTQKERLHPRHAQRPEGASRSASQGEEARALLQSRVALFWKVLCFIMLVACVVEVAGASDGPGASLIIDLALVAQAGAFWWLCGQGERSVRFSRTIEAAGMVMYFAGCALVGRYVLVDLVRERSIGTKDGILMADGYVAMMGLIGAVLMSAVRAALIPSSPRRTILYTALAGVPVVVTPTFVVPAPEGGFVIRALDSGALPWLPISLMILWSFVIITCTVISWVIYGLRTEIRRARQLGQYVLERKIGEGGMGEVYRAHHGMMRRPSALKLLRAEHASETSLVRFEREVQLTARLTHPNTITIFDYGRTDDGVFYYAMELLDGANLQRIVEVFGAQAQGRVVRILMMACGALAEAHSIGLIHRDIKPANIMLCTQGGEHDVVKLLDFGLVKQLTVDADVNVSVASTLAGTPLYMAPECIIAPESVDARTDIYALGAVAYYLLAGSDVFKGQTIVEVCSRHLHQQPEPFAERGITVSPALEAIVRACLEKEPARRPQSAGELRRQLEACGVEPWDGDSAQSWWLEHRAALDAVAASDGGDTRVIAVEGRLRSTLPPAG
ncbi:MAG TPA: serine/threonine-protein kinase [Polyangiaceae bacterium]|nr:serine/threonine-protein kinase [Polyangiaceae bacterium]